MHNLKDLRKNLEIFKKKFKDRNLEFDISEFTKIDKINRELINKKELLEQEKKSLSKSNDKSNFEKSKNISKQINQISLEQMKSQKNIDQIIFNLPNIAHEDVPIGKNEKENKMIKKIGKIKVFNFKIKSHIDLGSKNKSIDFETSTKLSGTRFVVLRDKIALLERALIKYRLDVHTNECGYTEIAHPFIVKEGKR